METPGKCKYTEKKVVKFSSLDGGMRPVELEWPLDTLPNFFAFDIDVTVRATIVYMGVGEYELQLEAEVQG